MYAIDGGKGRCVLQRGPVSVQSGSLLCLERVRMVNLHMIRVEKQVGYLSYAEAAGGQP